jgi:hypothetical protein
MAPQRMRPAAPMWYMSVKVVANELNDFNVIVSTVARKGGKRDT